MSRALNASSPINVKNVSGETAPAFAVLMVTGSEITDGELSYEVNKIDVSSETDGDTLLLVNSGRAMGTSGDEQYGNAQWFKDATWFGYDTGEGTPAFGEMWGVEDTEWLLQKDAPGISVIGEADTTNGIVVGQFQPEIIRHGHTTANITAASSWETGETTFTLKIGETSGTAGNLTESSFSLTVTNRSEDLSTSSTGIYVVIQWSWYYLEWIPTWVDCD